MFYTKDVSVTDNLSLGRFVDTDNFTSWEQRKNIKITDKFRYQHSVQFHSNTKGKFLKNERHNLYKCTFILQVDNYNNNNSYRIYIIRNHILWLDISADGGGVFVSLFFARRCSPDYFFRIQNGGLDSL